MHGHDGPGHDASQGQVSAARRFGKPAEDVEDVRLRSRLYSATSRPALLTCPRPPRRAPCGRDRHLVRGASAIGRDRLTIEERLSDIVEILAHGLLWLDVLRDYHGSIRSHISAVSSPKADYTDQAVSTALANVVPANTVSPEVTEV